MKQLLTKKKTPKRLTKTKITQTANKINGRKAIGQPAGNIIAEIDKLNIDPDTPIPLSEKEELWCLAYMRCKNKTEAAVVAYGQDRRTAGVTGCVLSKKATIRLRLAQLWQEEQKKYRLSKDDVLAELARIAKVNIHDFITIDGKSLSLKQGFDGKAVKSIKTTTDKNGETHIQLEFYSKEKALELYGKYHKLFTDGIDDGAMAKIQVFNIGGKEIEF